MSFDHWPLTGSLLQRLTSCSFKPKSVSNINFNLNIPSPVFTTANDVAGRICFHRHIPFWPYGVGCDEGGSANPHDWKWPDVKAFWQPPVREVHIKLERIFVSFI